MENCSQDVRIGLDHVESGKAFDGLRHVRGNDDGMSESGRPGLRPMGRCDLAQIKQKMLGYWKMLGD